MQTHIYHQYAEKCKFADTHIPACGHMSVHSIRRHTSAYADVCRHIRAYLSHRASYSYRLTYAAVWHTSAYADVCKRMLTHPRVPKSSSAMPLSAAASKRDLAEHADTDTSVCGTLQTHRYAYIRVSLIAAASKEKKKT